MDNSDQILIENAIQNYIGGRFAFFAGLQPAGAILFHRTIEFLLKGMLAHLGEETEWKHDLEKPWVNFKNSVNRDFASELDLTVADLNKFETLRYPNKRGGILERGMTGLYAFRRGEGEIRLSGSPPPHYELYVTEIDELFGAIWLATSVNPEFFTSKLTGDAKTYLIRENKARPFGTGAND